MAVRYGTVRYARILSQRYGALKKLNCGTLRWYGTISVKGTDTEYTHVFKPKM